MCAEEDEASDDVEELRLFLRWGGGWVVRDALWDWGGCSGNVGVMCRLFVGSLSALTVEGLAAPVVDTDVEGASTAACNVGKSGTYVGDQAWSSLSGSWKSNINSTVVVSLLFDQEPTDDTDP